MEVEHFLLFIRADGGARFVHFRELDIAVDMYQVSFVDVERCMEQLAELLDFPEICLESLTLRDADCLLQYARIASARGTRNTERLVYRRSGPRACSALKSLNCSLVSLTISFGEYLGFYWDDVEELRTMDSWSYLLDALSPHAQTLETFRCDYDIPNACGPHPPSSSSSPQQNTPHKLCFSAVRTLGLVCDLYPAGPIDVASLLPTFPNVTHLEIVPMFFKRHTDTLTPLGQSLRERNKAIFERDGCWAALEKCSGELGDLYNLGLVCHVVDLCIWSRIEHNYHLSMLATIVSTTRPKVLRLRVEYILFTFLAQVTKALRDSAFKSLDTLHIIIRHPCSKHDARRDDVTESIFAALTQLPSHIVTLELFIKCHPEADVQALDELRCRLIAHFKPTLRNVSILHADGHQLRPPPSGGGPQGVDSSYRDEDGYDSSDIGW
ncbi:hypothetical protein L227DRAFT_577473 [Lentinus tigrinus ALCF2SS1-6]|uniref:F-box domain-containing protein n=2 Tax=Lentinus tigrinus TaxID=5365 RepID=A0A5C2S3N9_9APHY|nr:hypothetical protein L227DRAFT_577473 [Lentinus tigrinus ALCF2SS1-6]